MGKASRSRSIAKRKLEKKKRKEAMKAQYKEWADRGQNQKSKRVRLATKRVSTLKLTSHAQGPCGNVGCKRCFPVFNDAHCAEV